MAEHKHRKLLNTGQLQTLEALRKFRFGSSELVGQYFGKSSGVFVYKRLKILQEQGYIGKRFDTSYRLKGKPAAYYLLAAGARALEESNVKAIYKDRTISEAFIQHCMDIFAIHNRFRLLYGDKLKFFTKTDLATYDYFPKPLPDAFVSLKDKQGTKRFFLDVIEAATPFFILERRIKHYTDYSESGEWEATDSDFPIILLVCETEALEKRLQKRIDRNSEDSSDELVFYTTTKAQIMAAAAEQDAIWQEATEPGTKLSL